MATIKVSKSLFSSCKTINDALNEAKNGDTIIIKKGKYDESLMIHKNISLVGEGEVVILGSIATSNTVDLQFENIKFNATIALQLKYARLTLTNCTIIGSVQMNKMRLLNCINCNFHLHREGMLLESCRKASLVNCTFDSQSGKALILTEQTNLTIKECKFENIKNEAIDAKETTLLISNSSFNRSIVLKSSTLTITNSTFTKVYSRAISAHQQSKIRVEHCHIQDSFIDVQNSIAHIEDTCITRPAFIQKAYHIIESEVTLIRCEASNVNSHGLYISNNSNVLLEDCYIHHNKDNNIFCSQSSLMMNNSRLHNAVNGILIDESDIQLNQCHVYGHTQHGLLTVTQPSNITINESTVSDNAISDIEEALEQVFYTIYGLRFLDRSLSEISTVKTDLFYSYEEAQREAIKRNIRPFYKRTQREQLNKASQLIGDQDQTSKLEKKNEQEPSRTSNCSNSTLTLSAMDDLNELIGLNLIKQNIKDLIDRIQFNRELQKFGLANEQHLSIAEHILLTGNPGTGKTTVAHILGKLYQELGLLNKGHVVQVNREKLVAEYIGHTAKRTQEKIDEAMGGILFIDEAYALTNKNSDKDFGPEAIEVLLEAMENNRGKFIVIAAGYEQDMEQFVESNPGLKSRFTRHFVLEDYSPTELVEISNLLVAKKHRILSEEAKLQLIKHYTEQWRQRDKFFANARLVRNDMSRIIEAQIKRCMSISEAERTREVLQLISAEDVIHALQLPVKKAFSVPINEELLASAVKELNNLIGLYHIKDEIHKMITLTRYYRDEGKDVNSLSVHIVLTGNPGTGKTIVARLIAKIHSALGIVERGELIEVSRNQLISQYNGETEKITTEAIEKAMDGTLFIDEAYQLTQYGTQDSGHKVIEVLLKYMEDYRGRFSVIVAGYPAEMDQFLKSNAGLQRRFTRHLHFNDYTPEQLMEICHSLVQAQGYTLAVSTAHALLTYYTNCYHKRDQSFGNAGMVRKDMVEAIKNLDYRIAKLSKVDREQMNKSEIQLDDCSHLF